jgi:protein-disulfide isomerase
MNSETKVISIILLITIGVIFIGLSLTKNSGNKTSIQINTNLLTSSSTPVSGTKEAKVSVVEFADFACPACAMLHPHLTSALSPYIESDQVSYALRLIPIHRNDSIVSAMAAFAADRISPQATTTKFFAMGKILLEKQSEWSGKPETKQKELFVNYAKTLDIDIVAFSKLMDSPVFREEVTGILSKDNADAQAMNIESTPTLIINGKQTIVGVQNTDILKQSIEAAIKETSI